MRAQVNYLTANRRHNASDNYIGELLFHCRQRRQWAGLAEAAGKKEEAACHLKKAAGYRAALKRAGYTGEI